MAGEQYDGLTIGERRLLFKTWLADLLADSAKYASPNFSQSMRYRDIAKICEDFAQSEDRRLPQRDD